jgi:hypothetical protein
MDRVEENRRIVDSLMVKESLMFIYQTLPDGGYDFHESFIFSLS